MYLMHIQCSLVRTAQKVNLEDLTFQQGPVLDVMHTPETQVMAWMVANGAMLAPIVGMGSVGIWLPCDDNLIAISFKHHLGLAKLVQQIRPVIKFETISKRMQSDQLSGARYIARHLALWIPCWLETMTVRQVGQRHPGAFQRYLGLDEAHPRKRKRLTCTHYQH